MNNFTHDEPAHVNAYVSDVHISESIGSRVATTKLQRKIVLHHIFISDQWIFNRNDTTPDSNNRYGGIFTVGAAGD